MKLLLSLLGLPLALAAVMPAAAADAMTPAEREAIVASAAQAAARQLNIEPTRLRLVPAQLKRGGDWAFLTANLKDAAGRRFDYAGTPLHEAAQAGGASDLVAALLKREGAAWKLVEIAVGPTDVAWDDWAERHHAPKSLFAW